jgi:hypothetical protein
MDKLRRGLQFLAKVGLSSLRLPVTGIRKLFKLIFHCGRKIIFVLRRPVSSVTYTLVGLVVVIGIIAGLVYAVNYLWNSRFATLYRDAFLAVYAHQMAGDVIPAEIDYIRSEAYEPFYEWGQTTNSEWLADYSRLIVPYFEWEELTARAFYPERIIWAPRLGYTSLRVGGWAWPPMSQVYMNERVLLEAMLVPEDADAGRILATLTHELVHIQGGNFFMSPSSVGEAGSAAWSAWIEQHTEAASTEILAAMCQYGDTNACRAFWLSIEDYARSSLKLELIRIFGKPGWWMYDLWADAFIRDANDVISANKSYRYWDAHYSDMISLLEKYGDFPYEHFVLPGVLRRLKMDTNIRNCWPVYTGYQCDILGLSYDDTAAMFGWKLFPLLSLGPSER